MYDKKIIEYIGDDGNLWIWCIITKTPLEEKGTYANPTHRAKSGTKRSIYW
jgi:hypothetical protein